MAFPGVSVRILSPEVTVGGQVILNPDVPSASCLTGPGADPGSVLTDSSGNASCYPVFGPVPGNDSVSVLVGGLSPTEFDQTASPKPLSAAIAYAEFFNRVQLAVTQVVPGQIRGGIEELNKVSPAQKMLGLILEKSFPSDSQAGYVTLQRRRTRVF